MVQEDCLLNVSLKDHTTIGCGGEADAFYLPRTEERLIELVSKSDQNRFILGNGSNVLPSDAGYRGRVICTKEVKHISREGNTVTASCGVTVTELLRFCLQNELSGLEFLVGIPATVGGLIYMNAGVGQLSVGNRIQSVRIFQEGAISEIPRERCNFSYRSSRFQGESAVILSASFRLFPAAGGDILHTMRYYAERRKRLPKGKSMGCVFRNPNGHLAGVLVQMCGLNGFRIGGAQIAATHGNFILNTANAASSDIETLIDWMKASVLSEFSIRLEEEIVYLKNDE